MGIDNRTTMDMDTCITGIELDIDTLNEILEEIFEVKIDDGVILELASFKPIKEEDEYLRI